MTTAIEGVEVELGRMSDDWRKFAIIVKVHSRKKPGLKATNEVDPGIVTNSAGLQQLINTAGAALAEHLGKKYKDNIDPGYAGALAVRAFITECLLQAKLQESIPEKLRALGGQKALMRDNERELVERCSFYVARGDSVTPRESLALDSIIARLQGREL